MARVGPRLTAACLLICVLGGCLQTGRPVVADRSPVFEPPRTVLEEGARAVPVYTVRKGDTLYSIAWRFELDYQGLARANGLVPPYVIHPGKQLRLRNQLPTGQRAVRASAASKPPAEKSESGRRQPTRWVWPLTHKPDVEFGKSSKGMDFGWADQAKTTARVRAAGSGEVVYAGNGIGGFERLVIIKHGSDLLSAYSFDGASLVAEQQRVKAGDAVADINNRGRIKQSLHFELRRDGEPINPRTVLR